ncbi:Acyl-coenzyme A diphosphatase fit1 [Erysiphe necator]|uniref:Acyl-coenzyme A diphosphatase SCS3 n=1 Tax=Uncinula necator TaxID=52586 RepID=A0A0B1P8L0_UNCNE|nr:Acyl-coenzyme A diphosphatase fit1 [Erysiphe necator]KHJ34593.1 putative inositol phospholipid biosynthesis protein scs3 [Erysiphe necator]
MNSSPNSKQGLSKIQDMPSVSTIETRESPKRISQLSPYIPTQLEIILLSIYPTTLVIGSLYSILNPATRSSPYNSNTQSHSQNTPPSYFAKKNNIFNTFFVKRGWAWITISYLYFLFSHPFTGSAGTLSPKRIQGLLRYGIVTLWWIFITQWFFGPPLIDRNFTLTGGKCELALSSHSYRDQRKFLTASACKAEGGHWKGGHDISGHVFLLVLGSMFLFEEVLHVVLRRRQEERIITMKDGAIKSASIVSENRFPTESLGIWTLGSKIAIGVATMCLYMLLMTAAYFHTWFEKLTGLMVALAGIFIAYFLPRIIPNIRTVIAMPGL